MTILSRPSVPVVALLLAVLAAAGAAQAATERRIGDITFTPCTVESPDGLRTFAAGCANFEVPEDRDRPNARRIALSMALIAAETPDPRPDPLVLLAGGPGQSAIEAWAAAQPGLARINRRRDVLLIDQRGTGQSNPLPCALDELMEEGDDAWHGAARDAAQACVEALGERAALAHYTTVDAVHDLEAVRQALGAPQFNLYGGSYGTRVALDYLRRHPEGVRSMILDGVVPPQRVLGQDHGRNLDAALDLIFTACRAEASCAERFGDPSAALDNLLRRTAERPQVVQLPDPLSHAPQEETLDDDTIVAVMRFMSYQPEFASLLPMLVDEAWEGRAQPLVAQGLMVYRRFTDRLMHGMELSVICSEDADLMTLDDSAAQTRMGTVIQSLFAAQCEVWPSKPRPADFHEPVTSDVPVLLLSGGWDPVTPPAFAEEAMQGLTHARHVVVPGGGHIVLDSACVPERADTFLETLAPAELDFDCLETLGPPAFFTGFHGTQP